MDCGQSGNDEGNDGDDLDDNDADYEEGDGFAGGFLAN